MPAIIPLGYVRISSMEQESGYGPEVQAAAIQSFCKRKGWTPAEIVQESASGESLLERHELKELIIRARDMQRAGQQACIIFYRLDRLARQLTDQEALVMQSAKEGFRLYSTQQAEEDTLDPAYMGDPARVMIRQIFGVFNQFERATIQSRLDSGLLAKARTGASTGGRTPFGYQSVNNDISIHPADHRAVIRMFQLRAGGMDPGDIASVLGREFPQCVHWHAQQVRRCLARQNLYRLGMYKTRVGAVPMHRPELVIVTGAAITTRSAPTIDWDRVAPTVSMNWIALTSGLNVGEVQSIISQRNVPVTWIKGRVYLDKAAAKQIVQGARDSVSKVDA